MTEKQLFEWLKENLDVAVWADVERGHATVRVQLKARDPVSGEWEVFAQDSQWLPIRDEGV